MLFVREYIRNLFKSTTPQIPTDPSEPCDICYCIRNHTACVQQRCLMSVPGCQPVFEDGVCCPVSYNCGGEFIISSDNIVVVLL